MRLQSFIRDPQPEDWVRVRFYASRIRKMYIDPTMFDSYYYVTALAPSVYPVLKSCLSTEPLLPDLQLFHWANPEKHEAEDLASLLLLLNSKASKIYIQMGNWSEHSMSQIISALRTFSENPAQTRSIHIQSPPCAPLEEAVLAIGLHQQQLLELSYNWHSETSLEAITYFARLDNLRRISIRADSRRTQEFLLWAREHGGHLFPSVQVFSLYTSSVGDCEHWLNLIRRPDLDAVDFYVAEAPTANALRELFTKLSVHPAREVLSRIDIRSEQPSPRNHPLYTILPDTIAPLLALSLTVLRLESEAPIDIDDEFAERMARAWPYLTFLELNGGYRRYPPAGVVPRVTLKGLIPFAEHCPNMLILALPISTDVSAFAEEYAAGQRPAGGASFQQCRLFGVGPSPIDQGADYLMIAGFLSDLCPELRHLKTSWGRPPPMTEAGEGDRSLDFEDLDMGDAWKQVEKYAVEMARVRRQERMWLE